MLDSKITSSVCLLRDGPAVVSRKPNFANVAPTKRRVSRSKRRARLSPYLEFLSKRRKADEPKLIKELKGQMKRMRESLGISQTIGIDSRTGAYFEAAYAGACIARDLGILPWSMKTIRRAFRTVYRVHRRHLGKEIAQSDPLLELRAYLDDHSENFLDARAGSLRASSNAVRAAPYIMLPSMNSDVEIDFAMSSYAFKKAFGERAPEILAALKGERLLRHDRGKLSTKRQVRMNCRDRLYVFSGRCLR